jgi:anti-sigma regulatory factor (Ser/Thr protein kinase)
MDESESGDSLYLTVSGTDRVASVLERVAQFTRLQGQGDANALLLVIRELLMNALVHGNESKVSRMVLVRIARMGELFEVQVDDEGEGFDYETLDLDLPDDPQSLEGRGRGRGLVLVHELSKTLVFERGGRRVRAIVRPDGTRPESAFGGFGPTKGNKFNRKKYSREATCTNPMGKSL